MEGQGPWIVDSGASNHNSGNNSNEEYQEYLRLKSTSQAQSSSIPSVSTACISQSVEGQGPWIVDLGASDHISSNNSLFSSIFSPHYISQWAQSCIKELVKLLFLPR